LLQISRMRSVVASREISMASNHKNESSSFMTAVDVGLTKTKPAMLAVLVFSFVINLYACFLS
jgi:hypothetical protein